MSIPTHFPASGARRSHPAIRAWRERFPDRPLLVVLAGTDLYCDLPDDAAARESLQLADRLVVLQDDAPHHLPRSVRHKTRTMLGRDYPGYFPVGDAKALAGLLLRSRAEPQFYRRLAGQRRARRALFAPSRERTVLLRLMREVLPDGH